MDKESMIIRTSESAINKGFLMGFILTVGIGAINFGYSLGVFNSLMFDFLNVFEIIDPKSRDSWSALLTAVCQLGAAVGSLSAGAFVKYGKKNCIHVNNILLSVGCALCLIKVI